METQSTYRRMDEWASWNTHCALPLNTTSGIGSLSTQSAVHEATPMGTWSDYASQASAPTRYRERGVYNTCSESETAQTDRYPAYGMRQMNAEQCGSGGASSMLPEFTQEDSPNEFSDLGGSSVGVASIMPANFYPNDDVIRWIQPLPESYPQPLENGGISMMALPWYEDDPAQWSNGKGYFPPSHSWAPSADGSEQCFGTPGRLGEGANSAGLYWVHGPTDSCFGFEQRNHEG
ncbi:hypothetical protein B0H17DRAFT_458461 [Mycena rosella]|uniref:Uncharacterized protein n=1 Tax=Mycena rosella TaxID=1033263 RepID=A0AAD7CCN2_MYCRO|nr:hypothetical protein B0H17DRAFT_458461 [Mycena rosella]